MSGLPADLRRWAWQAAQVVVLTALLFTVTNALVGQPFRVEQRSMEPTLAAGDHVLIDKLSTRWSPLGRGDVIVFDAPGSYGGDGIPYVKRVIGLPGETIQIENGRIYVTPVDGLPRRLAEAYLGDGEVTLPQGVEGRRSWTVPDDAYFVMGDNRSDSVDSRTFGVVPVDRIVGRALLRYLPLDRIGMLDGNGG